MKFKQKILYKPGTKRVVQKFAWFPIKLHKHDYSVWIWLEKYTSYQTYDYCHDRINCLHWFEDDRKQP